MLPGNTFGHPGDMIWENTCLSWTSRFAGFEINPNATEQEQKEEACFEFTQVLPDGQWFVPELGETGEGRVYWLTITPIYGPDASEAEHPWGWLTRPHTFGAAAVRMFQATSPGSSAQQDLMVPVWPPKLEVTWTSGESIDLGDYLWDLAFELASNVSNPEEPVRAALNHDGTVDSKDPAILGDSWLTPDR